VLLASGIAAGAALAASLSTLARSFLYEVSPLDPATYAAVPVLLIAIGGVAAVFPVRRAVQIDPGRVLRQL
jgi:hypothetical protein